MIGSFKTKVNNLMNERSESTHLLLKSNEQAKIEESDLMAERKCVSAS